MGRRAEEAAPAVPDLGAGFVTATLDHATGQVRIGYDNLEPDAMLAVARTLLDTAISLRVSAERQAVMAQVAEQIERVKTEEGEGARNQ